LEISNKAVHLHHTTHKPIKKMENFAHQLLKNELVWLKEIYNQKEKEKNIPQIEIKELEDKIMSLNVALNKISNY